MKPFNLDEALAGKPVITRDGKQVTQLTLFEIEGNFPLKGVVDKGFATWTTKGFFHDTQQNHPYNLFMASEKKSIWINIYENKSHMWSSYGYNSLEEANEANKVVINITDSVYIKTIEITNES